MDDDEQSKALEDLGIRQPEPDDPWPEFNARRQAELQAAWNADDCVHGSPDYDDCTEMGDHLWCSKCGSLGEFGNSADAGHQVDLPNDESDGRGFGYSWALPAQMYGERSLWGIPSALVQPGHDVRFHLVTQRPLFIRSIVVDMATAAAFYLDRIQVEDCIFSPIGDAAVPLSMMGATEVDGWPAATKIAQGGGHLPDLWNAPVLTNMQVELRVTNRAPHAVQFRGVLQVALEPRRR